MCSGTSRSVHVQVPRPPRATSITRRPTFTPAPSTPGLPVLCQPLTIPPVSHRREGGSENRPRKGGGGGESTRARVRGELRTPFSFKPRLFSRPEKRRGVHGALGHAATRGTSASVVSQVTCLLLEKTPPPKKRGKE